MANAHKDFNTAPLDPALEQEVRTIVNDLSLTEKEQGYCCCGK